MINDALNTLWRSVSDLKWYARLLRGSGWVTVWYTLFLVTLLAFSGTLALRFKQIPSFLQNWQTSQQEIVQHYPDDLVFDWNGTSLTTTHDPFLIPWPSWAKKSDRLPNYFTAVAPSLSDQEPVAAAENLDHGVLLMVTSQELHLSNLSGDWMTFPLSELPGFDQAFIVSKDNLPERLAGFGNELAAQLYQYWWWMFPIFWIGFLLEVLGLSLIYIGFVWVMGRLSNVNLGWLRTWQFTLHLSLLATAIKEIVSWVAGSDVSYLGPVAFWVLLLFIFQAIKPLLPKRLA